MSNTTKAGILRIIFTGSFFVVLFAPVNTEAISSSSYKIEEDFVGGGGAINSSSASYKADDILGGATGAGGAASSAYSLQSGPKTTDDPALTFSIDSGTVGLGSLSTSITRTGTATFSVSNYTSYGYTVQIIGAPPDNGAHTLTAMSAAGASNAGSEQFGINLVANTLPAVFGANPLQIPDSSFSFGAAASGYATANTYKFVSGDTIASAAKSSGKTSYTISYIANIANATPGGSYSGNQTLVAVGTY